MAQVAFPVFSYLPWIRELPDERWAKLENGSWTGGIGILQRREVDVVSLSVAIRPDGRSLVIDQPMPIYRHGCQMVIPRFLDCMCLALEA